MIQLQAAQVLMFMDFTVERVLRTWPHAQVMVASSYFGWMSFFMVVPRDGTRDKEARAQNRGEK